MRDTHRVSTTERIHSRLIKRDAEAEADLPEPVRRNVSRNSLRLVLAQALQSSGDQTVNASTVLPWLFHALGVPAALTGLLVPIRESGSMLPQALLTPLVLRVRRRKHVFVTGALVQAAAVAVMTATAALGQGLAAGVAIVLALAVFSLGRCLCSIASKDVQGRTVPKGERGQINGLATTASGLVAITLGLAVRAFGGDDLAPEQLALLLGAGALLWVLVAAVYTTVREPADETPPPSITGDGDEPNWFVQTFSMLRRDKDFRAFVTVRSFLLVSALSPPFIVLLAVRSGTGGLGGLGGFILASGVAALLGGRIFGRLADRSSKRLMAGGAAFASLVIVLLVVAVAVLDIGDGSVASYVLFVGCYFLLTLTHTGVRVGRKTYIVDMAEGDQRTTYVAVSNSAMGLVLLVVGSLSSALASLEVSWALLFLAGLGLLGVIASTRLPEVSSGS